MVDKRERGQFDSGRNLEPLEPIDISKVSDFDETLASMEKTSFGGRQLGDAAKILTEMFSDPDDLTVLTLSGAMTVAKQGLIICELIERGLVDAVVSTGALITHGLVEGMANSHYKVPNLSDEEMYERGICRVYDTVELETSFEHLHDLVDENFERLFPALDGKSAPRGSYDFLRRMGELLKEKHPGSRSILAAAAEADIPVFIPAFTDSELSLDIFIRRVKYDKDFWKDPFTRAAIPQFNPFDDLFHFAQKVYNHKGSLSIFTIGGGVPRNWAQQITPLFDIMSLENLPVEPRLYSRGVRICPEPVHWGGLSGCTYKEGVSWAKFLPESKGGKYAEVAADATVVLPFLIKGVIQRMEKQKK